MKKMALSLAFATAFALFAFSAEAGGVVTFEVAGRYSWTVPRGVAQICVTASGAGGGGGGGGLNYDIPEQKQAQLMRLGGGGGGGAAFVKKVFDVTPGQVLEISCGKGGRGGRQGSKSHTGEEGADGGSTSIRGLFSLNGGHGAKSPEYPYPHSPTVGGLPGGRGGQRGGYGAYGYKESMENSGMGGGTLTGFGGQPGNVFSPTGDDGCQGGGGGGGGARADSNSFGRGGNGGDGLVVIEWSRQEATEQAASRVSELSERVRIDTRGGDVYIDARAENPRTEELPNLVRNGPEVQWPELRNGKRVYKKLILQSALKTNRPNGGAHHEIRHNIPDVDEIWIDMERSFLYWLDGEKAQVPIVAANPSLSAIYWSTVTKTSMWYELSPVAARHAQEWEICLSYTKRSDPGLDADPGTGLLLPPWLR